MEADVIKLDLLNFKQRFPCTLPATGWFFAATPPDNAIILPPGTWTCMFNHLKKVSAGKQICFSKDSSGCSGAACYFGFRQPNEKAGEFLADKEKFKEKNAYGNAFYQQIKAEAPQKKYLVWCRLEKLEDRRSVEVVNYWVNPLILSGLVTLANFDSPENSNVAIPFASGCQSMWTLPYKERNKKHPRATIGALDPAMRQYIPPDTLMFSVPSKRFHIMAQNIDNSFADDDKWRSLAAQSTTCD